MDPPKQQTRPARDARAVWQGGPGSDRPAIFIGGTGRCGTTFFTALLGTHPEIAALPAESHLARRDEVRTFPDVLHRCPREKRPTLLAEFKRHWLTTYHRYKPTWWTPENQAWRGLHQWIAAEDIERHFPLLDALADLDSPAAMYTAYGRFLAGLFRTWADAEGKPLWAEKTPTNSLFAGFFVKCFPNVRFINLIRDGRDVACSLQHFPWGVKGLREALDWWAEMLVRTHRARAAYPPGTYLNLVHEELVCDTERVLRGVADFLEVSWADGLLEFDIRRNSVGRWRDEMPPDVQQYARERHGNLLRFWDHWYAGREGGPA